MEPVTYNLKIYRGRDFIKDFIFTDENGDLLPIDTWVLKSEIRTEKCVESDLLAEFTIVTFPNESRVTLMLSELETLALPEGKAYWDLLVSRNGVEDSFLCGKVKIECCVTEV